MGVVVWVAIGVLAVLEDACVGGRHVTDMAVFDVSGASEDGRNMSWSWVDSGLWRSAGLSTVMSEALSCAIAQAFLDLEFIKAKSERFLNLKLEPKWPKAIMVHYL